MLLTRTFYFHLFLLLTFQSFLFLLLFICLLDTHPISLNVSGFSFLFFNLSVAILSLQNGLLCYLPLHLAAERVDIPWFATSAIFSAGAATKQTSTNTGNSYRFFLLCLNFMFFTTLCMFFSILITVWLNGVFLSAVVEKKNVFGDKFNFMIY